MRTRFPRRRGAILLLTALIMVVLIGLAGLCVDVALFYVRKQANVNGCDAAALAGGGLLPNTSAAETAARRVAVANGLAGPISVSVLFPSSDEIVVESAEEVPYLLGGVFGLRSTRVRGRSRVTSGMANRIRGNSPVGLRPWGLDVSYSIRAGAAVTLKLGSRTQSGDVSTPGNFYALDIKPGTGASSYRGNILDGAQGIFQVGDLLKSEPGNMAGPTRDGVDGLLQKARQAPWATQSAPNITQDNPRLVILPIVDWSKAGNGSTQVPVLGFAAVYVTSMANDQLSGVFLTQMPFANAEVDSGLPTSELSGAVRVAKLVE